MTDSDAPRSERNACARVAARLPELLDGGLGPLEAARDEGHLEVCAACAAERDAWRAFGRRARAAEAQAAAQGLERALWGLEERLAGLALPAAPMPPARQRATLARAALPLAAAAAAVGALLALQQGGIGLEAPAREPWSAILPDVRPGIPSWDGLVHGDDAPRSAR
jgi:hypothetical protein